MRFTTLLAGASLALATPALADEMTKEAAVGPKVYAYASKANYCPEGLQPVSLSGVICCGAPNQKLSYQQMLAQGTGYARRTSRPDCPVGVKGCSSF